ncbi:MAG: SUMF1/EgtB/PvdO family nonheme iron enzyme [Bacteroidia bacterium]|nr:SUMF1/EgtB/PvdO family nonheme iron enzyme [Bacteroidia bacterium]
MRRVVYCCLFALLLPAAAGAQSLSLYDVDTRAYPLLRAKLLLYDNLGRRVASMSPAELRLSENGLPRTILRVECPPVTQPAPISAVLTLDASGSMEGPGLELAKAAAGAWIDAFPQGQSECAVTSFNFSNVLHQDFTNDRALLRGAVNRLRAGGGTSYDAALWHQFAGALPVLARGRHSRIVVLLTDGYASGDAQMILATARQLNARIYAVTLDNRMPDVLRTVAEQTGGRWFENVRSAAEAAAIFRGILDMAQDIPPCVIEWESDGCDFIRTVLCEAPGYGAAGGASYTLTADMLPLLEFLPSRVVAFGEVAAPSTVRKTVSITARNADVLIRSIAPEFPMFTIEDYGGSPPPFTLLRGQSRTLTLRYDAADSGYVVNRFFVDTDACEGGFFATAGTPGLGRDRRTIRLLHPNGGEVFVAGSDTVITWEGVAPTDAVNLDYSTNAGATWLPVARNVTGLAYNWRVPNTPSDHCLVRVTARMPDQIPSGMVIIPAGTFKRGDLIGTGSTEERPSQSVTLTRPFLMSVTEITQRQWLEVMSGNPSGVIGETLPVQAVSWVQAVEYCNRRSVMEGLDSCYVINGSMVYCDFGKNGYRLPTEAEWEYACRAGTSTDFWNGAMREPYCSPTDMSLDAAGWYCGNTSDPMPVGQKAVNGYGLRDVHGNVAELVWDVFAVYPSSDQTDPAGPNPRSSALNALLRGGHWRESATGCRASRRDQAGARNARTTDGFRVVRTY